MIKYEHDSLSPRKWVVKIVRDNFSYQARFFTERAAKIALEKWSKYSITK